MKLSNIFKTTAFILPFVMLTACNVRTAEKPHKNVMHSNEATISESEKLEQMQEINTVYFDFDKYNIKSEFAKALDSHAEFLISHPSFNIVIEGHADERGTPEYNIALGERRALAVKSYLQGRGVSAMQISIKSFGKEKPAVLGHDETSYAKNRRAVLVY